METNFSLRNFNYSKNEKENKTVDAADKKNFNDAVIDGTNTNQDELLKDVEGAINSKQSVFIKTDKGIIKIEKEKVPEALAGLKERLSKKEEFKLSGIGIDGPSKEFTVNFSKTPESKRTEAIAEARQQANNAGTAAYNIFKKERNEAMQLTDPVQRSDALEKASTNFQNALEKSNNVYVSALKTANSEFLKRVETEDPKHYPDIKKASEENLNSRVEAANNDTKGMQKAIQKYTSAVEGSFNIKNPQERASAQEKAISDLKKENKASLDQNDQTVDKANNKFNLVIISERDGVSAAAKKEDAQRAEGISAAREKANQSGTVAYKEYKQEIKDALQISDPDKRTAAVDKAMLKFQAAIQKSNDNYISDIKKANDTFLENVKVTDPDHYAAIKKAADENISSRIEAANNDTSTMVQAIKKYGYTVAAAADIKNPNERETAMQNASAELKKANKASMAQNDQTVEKAEGKYNIGLSVGREGVTPVIQKLEAERTNGINAAREKANQTGSAVYKEYKQEVKDAMQITNPDKRKEALDKATAKVNAALQKQNDTYTSEIKKVNDVFLEKIQNADPGHYTQLKIASEQNLNSRIDSANSDNSALQQAINKYTGAVKDSYNLKNPHERKAVQETALNDFKKENKASMEKNNLIVDNANSKFATDLMIILSLKPD
jgi:hypothetical protein